MKRLKDIIESEVAPSKHDMWLSKGSLKYFGPNGWTDVKTANLAQLADDVEDLNDRIVELELHKNPMVVMTEDEYDALEIKDPDTYYLIMED